ncbi:hypothetical protein MJO29_006023, partial [Puccinia striiformis f. sp. tritici]
MASNQAKQNTPSPTPAAPTTKAGSQLPKLEPELPVKSLKVDSLAVMKIVKHAPVAAQQLGPQRPEDSHSLAGASTTGALGHVISGFRPAVPRSGNRWDPATMYPRVLKKRAANPARGLSVLESWVRLTKGQMGPSSAGVTRGPARRSSARTGSLMHKQGHFGIQVQFHSTRRESSGLRTPITRPGFVPTVTSSQRPAAPSASAPVPQPKRKHNGATIPLASTKENASGLTFRSCGGQE